jgi:hypothetical protein
MAVDRGGRVSIVFASVAMKIKNVGSHLNGRSMIERGVFPLGMLIPERLSFEM